MKTLVLLITLCFLSTACSTYTAEEQRQWQKSNDPQSAYTPNRSR